MKQRDKIPYGQVHRFHSFVGAWLGTGDQQYLTAQEAIKLGNALVKAGRDIKKNPEFLNSQFTTFRLNENQD